MMTIAALDNRDLATSQPRSTFADLAADAPAGILRACAAGYRLAGRVPSLSTQRPPTPAEVDAYNNAIAEASDLFALIAAACRGLSADQGACL